MSTRDVTQILKNLSNPAGTYAVGGVPGTIQSNVNNLNCCGWTLAVAYENDQMLTSDLTIYRACDNSGADPVIVTGFQAPTEGEITARLFISAMEGDSGIEGDSYLVRNQLPLRHPKNCTTNDGDAISGTNNPCLNFFGSQINTTLAIDPDPVTGKLVSTGSSTMDTRGSYGPINSDFTKPPSWATGARQGWDITSCDISDKIKNKDTVLYVQGTTTNDVYTVNALGIQIQNQAPIIKSTKMASVTSVSNVGETFTYTCTFENISAKATGLVFSDALPDGLVYVAGTYNQIGGTPPEGDPGTPSGFTDVPSET